MCGIAGLVGGLTGFGTEQLVDLGRRLGGTLAHRGPDDQGVWVETANKAVLAHQRLAIVDLSSAGRQPMVSACGRWVVVYNGELYNTASLRERLGGRSDRFRGHSDTEVLLQAIAEWGVERALCQATGMFAFAVWDQHEQELWLARDRFGEKPLYFGWHERSFIFASELKAFRAIPGFSPEVDRTALDQYFRWGYVPEPRSIFENISKLGPGQFLKVDQSGRFSSPESYWSARSEVELAPGQPGGTESVDLLGELLDRTVADRMVADVPVGAFLSGGVDSSAIVASMKRVSSAPVRTFTIGFTDRAFDESPYAAEVAECLGSDHTELILTPEQAMEIIPRLPTIYDEPFADSSQIPTFLVSQMARNHVTVALSGDGGDELFGGYERYRLASALGRTQKLVPARARSMTGAFVKSLSVDNWNRMARVLPSVVLPSGLRHRTGQRLHKAATAFASSTFPDAYGSLIGIDHGGNGLVLGAGQPCAGFDSIDASTLEQFTPFEQAMLVDTLTYLPGDLLTKVDRASMAVSLEVRAPFLDPTLFEFAWGLAGADRVRDGRGKWVLRELLRRSLPDHLVDRPKMGFGVPIGDWLRGPLKSWAEDLLDPNLVEAQGYLNPETVTLEWHSHRDGHADLTPQIWALLMFQAWLAEADL
jgi:asparagine synthase (glutamine-hydrolysing)